MAAPKECAADSWAVLGPAVPLTGKLVLLGRPEMIRRNSQG